MKKVITYLKLVVLFVLISACSQQVTYKNQTSSFPIDSTYQKNEIVKQLITPYKISLEKEMNEVLVVSAEEFPADRNKAETKLGNLVADLSLEIAQQMYDGNIDFCLLNFGGLRTSLPKGKITREKIFELMPFENELVVITLSQDSLNSLYNYLKISNGQPISKNLNLTFSKNNIEIVEDWTNNDSIEVLTSDYLANGGDKMYFFTNPIKIEKVGIKLRDAIIQYCIEQQKHNKQLTSKLDGRITFE